MANTNDPVSVPAVKPEAPASNEAVPAAVTEAVSAAVKTGWMASKGKIGMVVGGSLITLVGGAYGVKLIGAGSPRAAAQQQLAEKKSGFEPPPKPDADEPRKLSKGITDLPSTDLPPVAAPKVEQAGGEAGKTKAPVKPAVDVDILDLKAPPVPTGAIDITPPDVKFPAKPLIPPGKGEPAELPSTNKGTVVQPSEPTIIRVGAQEGKDKADTPKAPKIDLDPLPEVSAPKIGGSTPAPVPANLNLDIPAPLPVSAPPKLPDVVSPPPGITEPKPSAPGVTEPKAPGVAEPKIAAPGIGEPKPGTATGPAPVIGVPVGPAGLPSPKNLQIEPPIKIDVPTINPGVGPAPKPLGTPDVKAPGTSDLLIPGAPKVETPDIRINSPMIDTPPKAPAIGLEPSPRPGGSPKPPAPAVKREDYDEDWHTFKAGDDYAMISREYYKSADYARALEAYNKDRRRGNEDIVRVPPLWVLEDKFPGMIGSGKTETKAPSGGTGKTTGLSFEPVEGRQIGTSAPPARPAPTPAPVISPVSNFNDEYRVRAEGGENIRDIARKVYGDAKAWKRIYDMNPSIDPTEPVPAGTTLRMPR